jgi:hypothetical protein
LICVNPKCKYGETRVKSVVVYRTFKYRIRWCPRCGTTFQTHEFLIPDTVVECNFEPLQAELDFFKPNKKEEK